MGQIRSKNNFDFLKVNGSIQDHDRENRDVNGYVKIQLKKLTR